MAENSRKRGGAEKAGKIKGGRAGGGGGVGGKCTQKTGSFPNCRTAGRRIRWRVPELTYTIILYNIL